MVAVNWRHLQKSIDYWADLGFTYREVPWIIPEKYNMVTCPSRDFLVNSKLGSHVGSAEQSFIYLDHMGQLPKGKWIACTPCFRTEPVLDDLHQSGFMKVELYQTDDISLTGLNDVIINAMTFFKYVVSNAHCDPELVKIEPTSEGYDITIGGIEVGSYGIRHYDNISWIYGTAVAEPRLSTVIHRIIANAR